MNISIYKISKDNQNLASSSMLPSPASVNSSIVISSASSSQAEKGLGPVDPLIMLMPRIAGLSERRAGFSLSVPCGDQGTSGIEVLGFCFDGVECGVECFEVALEGVRERLLLVLVLRFGVTF